MSVNIYEVYTVEVIDYTHDGLGIGKVDGFPLFIEGAIMGEVLNVEVTKTKKNLAFARIKEIITASVNRTIPQCSVYQQCGGCRMQHMSYEAELSFKTAKVRNTINRFLKSSYDVNDTCPSPLVDSYRNKVQMPVGYDSSNNIISGFYASNSHNIIKTDYCLLQSKSVNDIIEYSKKLLSKYDIKPFNPQTNSGSLSHIMLRENSKGEIMLIFVTKKPKSLKMSGLVDDLVKIFPNIKTIVQNINLQKTNVILGKENIVLLGEGYFYDYIGDCRFKISPHSFFQVNNSQTVKLYDVVKKYAQISKGSVLVDAYCGVGSIGIYVGKDVGHLYGIEITPSAVLDAEYNASLNNVKKADFILGKTEDVLPKLIEKGISLDVLIVDPPRKGCTNTLLETIANSDVKRVVYVSCDVATLARDLSILTTFNYKIKEIQPVDMFPRTFHVETVVVLERI